MKRLRGVYFWELFPLRVVAITLGVIFLAEALIMGLFAFAFGPSRNPVLESLVDALLLTAVVAPILIWLIFEPLRRIASVRGQLLGQSYEIQDEERRRIARDLHDEIGQAFTSLLVGLRVLEGSQSLETVREQAIQLRQLGGDVYDQIRNLARGLHLAVLDDLGLQAAVQRLAEDTETTHGVDVVFCDAGLDGVRLDRNIETTVYRIVQEALTNCVKHAQATHVEIKLTRDASMLTGIVSDNGRGFDVGAVLQSSQLTSFGLSSMRERALILNGTFHIRSNPGIGTSITFRIPLEK